MKRFSYKRWANGVAAQILRSDLDCGFAVANGTPNPDKAREAMMAIVNKLLRAEKRGRRYADSPSIPNQDKIMP